MLIETTVDFESAFEGKVKTCRVVIDLETQLVLHYIEPRPGVTRVVFDDASLCINMAFDDFHEHYERFKQSDRLGIDLGP